jgi:cell division protein FtsL
MTIIKPHKNFELKHFIVSLFALLILGSGFYILEYNSLVTERYEVRDLKQAVDRAREVNADLKNALYERLDPSKLKPLAAAHGLTIDRNPEYLTFSPWRSVSSY